ncbi:MAG TPA: ribokinase [Actinomycetota bacterium]|jgi:ribokinase|nr:ribokinase [Actinomycetota bacterium]
MSAKPRVAVVGAVNVDLVVQLERLPVAGETMTDGTFSRHQGGKGGNQAVGAARALGDAGDVVMICAVGRDDLGREALDALRGERITLEPAEPASDLPTGVALILVDRKGENQIAVAPGANDALDPQVVREALEHSTPSVVLASLEVPDAAVVAAAEWCDEHDVAFVLNPAPMNAQLVRDLRDRTAYLIPNQHELEQLGDAARRAIVIETRGSDGVRIRDENGDEQLSAPAVDAVDTTGAGDCFSGVFAAGLAEGRPLREAVERAIAAAAMSVTVSGAREGMPTRRQLDEHLSNQPVVDRSS